MTDKNEKPYIRLLRREQRKVIFEYYKCKAKLYSLANFAKKYNATLILDDHLLVFVFQTEAIAKRIVEQWNIEN